MYRRPVNKSKYRLKNIQWMDLVRQISILKSTDIIFDNHTKIARCQWDDSYSIAREFIYSILF